MDRIKISLLGAGFMGKKHLEILKVNPNFELIAVIDHEVQPKLADKVKIYQDLTSFLENDRETRLLLIATPNYLHYRQAKTALQHGYHIVLEKPVCLSAAEASELLELAREMNLQIFSIMQNHFSGSSSWLRNLLESGILGRVYMAQTQCLWNRDERYYQPESWKGQKEMDGGTLYTQFYHFLNLNQSLFGEYKFVKPLLKTFRHGNLVDFEDTAFLLCEFESGTIGNLNFTTAIYDKNLESSLTIIAENGTVKISGQYFNHVELCNIKDYDFDAEKVEATDNVENLQRNFNHIHQAFFSRERNNEEMEQNIKLLSLIEEIYTYSPTTIPT